MPVDPGQTPYTVFWSKTARESVRKLITEASPIGIKQEVVEVIQALDERLRHDPLDLGEVRWGKGSIKVCVAVRKFLAIRFACLDLVCEDRIGSEERAFNSSSAAPFRSWPTYPSALQSD